MARKGDIISAMSSDEEDEAEEQPPKMEVRIESIRGPLDNGRVVDSRITSGRGGGAQGRVQGPLHLLSRFRLASIARARF